MARGFTWGLGFLAVALTSDCSQPGDLREVELPQMAPVVQLGTTGAEHTGLSMASRASTVAVVWAATIGSQTNIFAAVSGDGGRQFAPAVRVNDVDGDARVSGEQPPRVAITNRDIVVAWTSRVDGRGRVRMARSGDGGRSFAAATTVHEDALPGIRGWTSLAVGPRDEVHLAWLDGRHAATLMAAAAPGHGAHGSMRQDLYHATIAPDGQVTERAVATDVCFCCKTGLAVGDEGQTYVAWRHIYPTQLRDMAVARSVDAGESFSAPVRVSEDGWQINGCPEDGPSIAASSSDVLHIAWPTLVPAATAVKGIFYSSSTDGGLTFASRVRLDTESDHVAAHPQIALAGDEVAVVWDESDRDGSDIRLRRFTRSAAATGRTFTVSDSRRVKYPVLATTDDGTIVAWIAGAGAESTIRLRHVER